MHPLRYLIIYVLSGIGIASLFTQGIATFTLPFIIFGVVPLAEILLPGTPENLAPPEEKARLDSPVYTGLLYLAVPALIVALALLMIRAESGALSGLSLLGGIATVGSLVGALGLNVGHELGHRSNTAHHRTSKLLYLSAHYMHFFTEHNLGHHMRVATDADPASAKRGDWLYSRWVRSIVGGVRSAWHIETTRIARKGHGALSIHNAVLRGFVIQAVCLLAVGLVLGPTAVAAWLGAALVGVLMLETVNYVEHYGLRRGDNGRGRPERVQPHHSWNSNHALGRMLLFDLSRHSDHHANPRRPYPVLRHFDDAPQLPTGYPGMMVLATIPPVFHAVMARELDRVQQAHPVSVAAEPTAA